MSECPTCDHDRGILCLDCFLQVDDARLPGTYARYVSWAAGYDVRRVGSITPVLLMLMPVVGFAMTVLAH